MSFIQFICSTFCRYFNPIYATICQKISKQRINDTIIICFASYILNCIDRVTNNKYLCVLFTLLGYHKVRDWHFYDINIHKKCLYAIYINTSILKWAPFGDIAKVYLS